MHRWSRVSSKSCQLEEQWRSHAYEARVLLKPHRLDENDRRGERQVPVFGGNTFAEVTYPGLNNPLLIHGPFSGLVAREVEVL